MGYQAALDLAELAKKYGLLRDPFVQTGLRVLVMDDDPEIQEDIGGYIAFRALDKMRHGYRRNHRYR